MNILYIKMKASVLIYHSTIVIKDVSEILCDDLSLVSKVEKISVGAFYNSKEEHQIISIMKIMEEVKKVYSDLCIVPLGETETIVHYGQKLNSKQQKKKMQIEVIKVIAVSCICFLGTAFTIMSFHTDIGIRNLFEDFYHILGLPYKEGLGIFELFYSIGLGLGILIFFNHFGKKKFTEDPTPMQVEMNTYETAVNQTLVEMDEKQKDKQNSGEGVK